MGEILCFVDDRKILLQVDRCSLLCDLCQRTQPLRTQMTSSVKWGEYEAPPKTHDRVNWMTHRALSAWHTVGVQ